MRWHSSWIKFGGIALLSLVGLFIYAQTFDSAYHLDDFFFIKANPGIRDLSNWQNYGKGVVDTHSRYAVFATFAVNYAIHNIEVWGYHVVNFIIHLLTSMGIWWLALLFFRTPKFKHQFTPQVRLYLSFFVAFLFLAHPVNTQAVTYISQRFASMATLFYVWALAMYIYARLFSKAAKQILSFCLSFVFLAIAVLSKEISLTFPLIVVFLEVFFLHEEKHFDFKRFIKKNWFVLTVFLVLAMIIPLKFGFRVIEMFNDVWPSESHEGDLLTAWTYFLTQWRVWVVFLRLIVVPINQNLDYDFPMSHSFIDPITTLFSFLFVVGLCVVVWFKRKSWPHCLLGIGWFVLTLSVNFIPRSHVIFEHKLYLAMIGFLFAYVVTVSMIWKQNRSRLFVLVLSVFVLSILTFNRNKVWETELTLWQDVVKKSPNKYRVNLNLGKAYVETGDLEKAMTYLNKALELKPGDEKALNNRGLVFHKWKQFDKALADFNQAEASSSNYVEVYNNRGVVYKDLEEYDKAIEDYKKAIQINPYQAETYNNLGVVLRKQKRYQEALNVLTRAFKLKFEKYPDALLNIGNVYRDLGDPQQALKYYSHAIALQQNNPIYFANRANVHNDLNMKQQAYNDFTQAIALNPQMTVLYLSRGIFLQNNNKLKEAAQDYSRALELDPNNIQALNNIGVVLMRMQQYRPAMNAAIRAIRLNPRLPSAFFVLISSCIDSGGVEECLSYVEQAQKIGYNFDEKLQKRIDALKSKK